MRRHTLPALLILAASALAGVAQATDLGLPRPAPIARAADPDALNGFDPIEANATCEGCHTEIAAEWQASLHKQAWVDPLFLAAYAIEEQAFCRSCHAPEADPAAEPGPAARAVGVACTTCHVQDGAIVGASPSPNAPHEVVADPRLGTVEACASCHQFDFPDLGMPMQNTLREHARSSMRDVPCQSCHMPSVGEGERRHKSHDFSILARPDRIQSAVEMQAARFEEGIALELEAAFVGHAFPTGDMFRRLEARAVAVDTEGRVVGTAAPVHLGRVFADRARHGFGEDLSFVRRQVADLRVPPPGQGARRVELRFDVPVGEHTVRWTVVYQRMSTAMAASFGIDQTLDEIVVKEGVLAPQQKSTEGGS